jgi:hypothetical protein
MSKDIDILSNELSDDNEDIYQIGNWFWYEEKPGIKKYLVCLSAIGSNYYEVQRPEIGEHRWCPDRIHIDEVYKKLFIVENIQQELHNRAENARLDMDCCIAEVNELTQRLGLQNTIKIGSNHISENQGNALAVMSSHIDVNDLKNQLITAKEETLPELFKKIKAATKLYGDWMSAEVLPLKVQAENMTKTVNYIDDKIFSISLYAGITEDFLQCKKGESADISEKLHVMQRKLFMDEECLLDYDAGGMTFKSLSDFNKWLIRPQNLKRILPFERCIVAMQIRRNEKERALTNLIDFVNNSKERLTDKYTYLYVRNGDNVYCIISELEYDELLFPEADHQFGITEPMMFRNEWSDYKLKTVSELELDIKAEKENIKKWKKDQLRKKAEWKKEEHDGREWNGSFYHSPNEELYKLEQYKKLDDTSVYLDDVNDSISTKIKKFNRIALIIQGLFDRSEFLHPHRPVKSWLPESFDENIKLIYDSSNTLYSSAEPPDYHKYIQSLNDQINENSIFAGAHAQWYLKEYEKAERKMDRDWRTNDFSRPESYMQYGNRGPGRIAIPERIIMRSKSAIFSWERERQNWRYDLDDYIKCTIKIPFDNLINVSAYKKGDYKQFFQDPRTRQEYLKWAPILLRAEDYAHGKVQAQKPVKKEVIT